jgi:hypothetical protein
MNTRFRACIGDFARRPTTSGPFQSLRPPSRLLFDWLATPGAAPQQGQQFLIDHLGRRQAAANIGHQELLRLRPVRWALSGNVLPVSEGKG